MIGKFQSSLAAIDARLIVLAFIPVFLSLSSPQASAAPTESHCNQKIFQTRPSKQFSMDRGMAFLGIHLRRNSRDA
jgi:hypothetical protein